MQRIVLLCPRDRAECEIVRNFRRLWSYDLVALYKYVYYYYYYYYFLPLLAFYMIPSDDKN